MNFPLSFARNVQIIFSFLPACLVFIFISFSSPAATEKLFLANIFPFPLFAVYARN